MVELALLVALAQVPAVGVDPEDPPGSLGDVIDNVYDMAGKAGSPFMTYLRPVKVFAGATLGLEGDSRALFGGSLNALRIGQIWGRADVVTLDLGASTDLHNASFNWGVTVVQLREFVCRDPDEYRKDPTQAFKGVSLPFIYKEFDFSKPCMQGEWLGYFADLFSFAGQTDSGHWGVRFFELGPFVDVLGNGRTIDVWRNRLEIRISPALEYVQLGRGAGDHVALRALFGLRAAASSFKRDVRFAVDAAWRPNLLDPTDNLVESSATLSTFFGPTAGGREIGVMLGLRARLSYASKPGTVISTWADPSRKLEVGVDLVGEFLWWKPG